MKNFARAALILAVILVCSAAKAQKKDYSLLRSDSIIQEFDSLFSSEDSLSIFRLLDSIIQLPELKETSQFAIRAGYNSNVVATSRTIGFNQFGIAPGVSYYHKSGLYADFASYWSQQYCPSVYLSVLSGGYLKTVGTHWSFVADYSHYFYSSTASGTYNPYTNNAGMSNYFQIKPVTLRLDYYLYFGKKTAHRIMPGISFTLQKRNWLGLDRVSFYPAFNVLFGTDDVVTNYLPYSDLIKRIRQNKSRPPDQQLPLYYTVNKNEFGVMNYSFTAPLSLTFKDWNLLISYTYNIPKALPYEDISLQNGGYVSASLTRYITFRTDSRRSRQEKLIYLPNR